MALKAGRFWREGEPLPMLTMSPEYSQLEGVESAGMQICLSKGFKV